MKKEKMQSNEGIKKEEPEFIHDGYAIGNNLRMLREKKKLTQMQVANELDVSYVHYAKIEEGMRGMSLKMLFKFIDFFKTDANTILGVYKE